MAQRLAIAQQVQSGKITAAEGAAAIEQRRSEMISEGQRRNAIAQMAAAQQRAANAAATAADAQAFSNAIWAANAAFAAQPQTVRVQTTCMQLGHMTDCY